MRFPETFPQTTVERIDAWRCEVPLPRPIEVAGTSLRQRDYVVVRMRDSDGVDGCAFGLARGAPVDLVVSDLLAPALLGGPADPSAVEATCAERLLIVGAAGIAGRARSLLDICAWDIAATHAGEPLWRLLRGDRAPEAQPAPCMLVEGYPVEGEPVEALADRLGMAVQRGYRMLKLAKHGDAAHMDRVLESTRTAVGDGVALTVDCAWSWRESAAAEREVGRWERHGLSWVEDPFPAGMAAETAALRRAVGVPIAVGDEVTDVAVFDRLIAADALDVVRLDATTIGGFSSFVRLLERIPERPVSPHVFPEIHRHCVFASPRVGPIELFRPLAGFDVLHELVEPVAVERGHVRAPEAPGLGISMNWEAVEAYAVRSATAASDRAPAG